MPETMRDQERETGRCYTFIHRERQKQRERKRERDRERQRE